MVIIFLIFHYCFIKAFYRLCAAYLCVAVFILLAVFSPCGLTAKRSYSKIYENYEFYLRISKKSIIFAPEIRVEREMSLFYGGFRTYLLSVYWRLFCASKLRNFWLLRNSCNDISFTGVYNTCARLVISIDLTGSYYIRCGLSLAFFRSRAEQIPWSVDSKSLRFFVRIIIVSGSLKTPTKNKKYIEKPVENPKQSRQSNTTWRNNTHMT